MKRPKLKKASKRLSCAKRYKIQKKVREHHRKLRKEAKKSGISRKPKKDVGVPNSAPFKEDILREAEQRKQELQELNEKKRLAKQKERAEKRKKAKEAASAEPKSKKAKKQEKLKAKKDARAAVAKKKSSKTFRCNELNKVLEASDVIVEVLDARDPQGCRCPQLEEAVMKHQDKRLLLLINKIDLVPKDNLEKWLGYLQTQCPTYLFKSATQQQDRTVLEKKQRASSGAPDRSRAGASIGCDSLLQTLNLLADQLDGDTMLKVGVVGFPNVGKSSVINSLKKMRACPAGVQRGLTKCMQEVHISKKVKMIDSPAIVAAAENSGDKLALRSVMVEEGEESPLDAAGSLMKQCSQQSIMLQYTVPDYRNALEFFTLLAKRRGYLQKGGSPNAESAATAFLGDFTGSKLSYYTKVPESTDLPPHLSQPLVARMQEGVDVERVKTTNHNIIKHLRCPNPSSSMSFNSKGTTDGCLSVSEIPQLKSITVEEEEEEELDDDEEEEEEEEENIDLTEDMEEAEDVEEVEIAEKTQKLPQHDNTGKAAKNKTIPACVDVDVLAGRQTEDDAYDFSTDFV